MISPSDKRAAAIAAGWTYFHSAALGMECSCRVTPYGPELYTADKTYYHPAEIKRMKTAGVEMEKSVHIAKKLFDGEIVSIVG